MKLRGLPTLLLGLFLLGCTHDSDIDGAGANSDGTTNVNIKATLPEFGGATRGVDSSKGGVANIDWTKYELRIIVKAYGTGDYAGKVATEAVDYKVAEKDASGNYLPISIDLDLPLTIGHSYDIYLWADYVLQSEPTNDLHYNIDKFPAITLKGDNQLVINDETRDAFFGRNRVYIKSTGIVWDKPMNTMIERAVTKLRLVATDAAGASATSAKLQVGKLYTGFNIATGELTAATSTPITSIKTAFEIYSTETPAEEDTEYSMSFITAYMLWPASESVAIVGSFYEDGKDDPVSEVAPTSDIALKRGNLTTLRGEMFDTGWNGTTLTEPMTIDGDWLVLNDATELAWVLEYEDTKEKDKIRITKDMNMGGFTVNPFPINVAEFDGDEHTISNVVVDGNSLFTIDKALSIHDLDVDTITVGDNETTGHVGVLLDEVKLADGDNITYSNVSITNATVGTTDGAAGGLIGYIGRDDETNRDVTYTVTIDNCDLTDVVASGNLSEGHLVGLFSGYDSGETLKINDNCTVTTTSTRVDDYISHYTAEQQSCWLEAVDAKYDGLLGDEVYHRGTLYYGDKLFVAKWDGVTTVTPLTEDGKSVIYSAFDMAKLATEASASVKLMSNVDMGGKSIATLKNSITTFDGNSKTIYNVAVSGSSLFASNGAVQSLTIDGATIGTDTTTGNVGVIYSEIRTTGAVGISNLTVKNATLKTTDGNVGGIVGYVGRTTENDRNTSLTATFTNCHGENITGTQDAHVGQLVGQFGGYDMNEKLVFTNCTSKPATGYTSIYRADQQSCWRTAIGATTFDGILGAEKFYRGTIMFGDKQFSPKWDGETKVDPLTESGAYLIYSPFDLAGVRKITASPSAIFLRSDIDMNGQGVDGKYNVPSNFTQSAYSSADDNHFDPFNYVTTLDGYKDASNNYSIWNLSISQIEQERAAFILYASGTTTHKNINFRNCCTVSVHKPVETDAKAYGAILVSNVDATYTMENVHAYDCKVFALQKVGTLGARISGTSKLTNCSVNSCYVENYECNISERFESGKKSMGGFTVNNVYADFYPYGEVGGMFGFIQGNSTITNCWTKGTTIYAFGQNDKEATIDASWLIKTGVKALGYYLVPGRHVSTLIGNIRATGTISINNSGADSASKCTKRYDTHQWRVKTGGSSWNPTYTYYKYDYIGQAYYVKFLDSEGTVTVDGTSITIGDCKTSTLYDTY